MQGYQNGTFPAFVKDYGASETKSGALQLFIAFDVEFPDGDSQHYRETMVWRGNLQPGKPTDITMRALLAAGFAGSDPLTVADGPDAKALPMGYEVSVVVEQERSQDGQKNFHKIAWVNKKGGSVGVKRVDPAVVKAKLEARRAELKMKLEAERKKEGAAVIGGEDDIPF